MASLHFWTGASERTSSLGWKQRLVADFGLGENYEPGNREQLRRALLLLSERHPGEAEAHCRSFFDACLDSVNVHAEMRQYLADSLALSREISRDSCRRS